MRGASLPSFYKIMTFREKVTELLEQGLSEKPSVFLIDLNISDGFKITVTLDGDNGVTLQDCIDISRAIEHNLDREEQDFSLEVASAGVSAPLKNTRQYKKNIGRTLKIKTGSENIEGELVAANEEFITLAWEAREPKKIGKGKETVQKTQQVPYSEIKEAMVTITFN
jgi:ribosome maturation factor RimP